MFNSTYKKSICKICALFLITLFVAISAVTLSACDGDNLSDTLIVGTTDEIDTLNRLEASGGMPGYAYTMLSSTLAQVPIVYRADGEFDSAICDIENSADGLIWRFKLKNTFYWHDGNAVTLADIEYTLKNTVPSQSVAEISIKDGAVEIKLASANILFLDSLISAIIQPKHILSTVTKDSITDVQSVIGCGPFKFADRSLDSGTLTFERFDKYPYAGDISLKYVIFKTFNSADSMYLALKAGEIDTVWSYGGGLGKNEYEDLGANQKLKLLSYSTNAIPKVLFFNNKVMTDTRVKNAIKKAIDYNKLARIFGTSDSCIPREGFVAPNVFGYKETNLLTRDLNGAKALLSQAGYNETSKFQFRLLVRSSGDDSQYADMIKTDLEETGMINVVLEVKGSDWQSYYQEARHMASLATVTAAGYNFDAGYATRYLMTTVNSAMQASGVAKNPVAHGQLEIDDGAGGLTEFGAIRKALDDAVSKNDAFKAAVASYQDYMVAQTPAIALLYGVKTQVVSARLSGYAIDDTFGHINVQSFTTLKKSNR